MPVVDDLAKILGKSSNFNKSLLTKEKVGFAAVVDTDGKYLIFALFKQAGRARAAGSQLKKEMKGLREVKGAKMCYGETTLMDGEIVWAIAGGDAQISLIKRGIKSSKFKEICKKARANILINTLKTAKFVVSGVDSEQQDQIAEEAAKISTADKMAMLNAISSSDDGEDISWTEQEIEEMFLAQRSLDLSDAVRKQEEYEQGQVEEKILSSQTEIQELQSEFHNLVAATAYEDLSPEAREQISSQERQLAEERRALMPMLSVGESLSDDVGGSISSDLREATMVTRSVQMGKLIREVSAVEEGLRQLNGQITDAPTPAQQDALDTLLSALQNVHDDYEALLIDKES